MNEQRNKRLSNQMAEIYKRGTIKEGGETTVQKGRGSWGRMCPGPCELEPWGSS